MMNKTYIQPTIKSVRMTCAQLVSTSLQGGNPVEDGNANTRGHRGSWGNLWDGGEEE